MYHFFVEPSQIEKEVIRVTGPDVNHIKNVLRMRPGEKVLVSNKIDCDYLCEIEILSAEMVQLKILEVAQDKMELPARIWLFQGLPKGDKMELIIQKAIELGVYKIVPVMTKRAVVKLDEKKEAARLKRWNAIAESAAKQSKRIMIPEVTGVKSFQDAMESIKNFDLKLIPYECAEGISATRRLIERAKPGMDIAVIIGPEGGFEDEEILRAKEAGIEPITLGKRILRTETAGLCVLSVLMIQLEEL